MNALDKLALLYPSVRPFLYTKNATDSALRVTLDLKRWFSISGVQIDQRWPELTNIACNASVLRRYALDYFNNQRLDTTLEKLGRFAELGEIRLCFRPSIDHDHITALFLDDIRRDQLPAAGAFCVAIETSTDNFHVHYALSRPITDTEARRILRHFAKHLGLGDVGALGLEQPRRLPTEGLEVIVEDRVLDVSTLLQQASVSRTPDYATFTDHDWRTRTGPLRLQAYWDKIAEGAPRKSDGTTPDYSWVDFIVCVNKAREGFTDVAIFDGLSEVQRPDGNTFCAKYDSMADRIAYVKRMTSKAKMPEPVKVPKL